MGRRGVVLAVNVAVLVGLALLMWAPWLPAQAAEARVEEGFGAAWQGVADGCGFNCQGCGVTAVRRLLLGYAVEIEYACGMLPVDTHEFHRVETLYVSPLGTVHGLRQP
jgi:hypothetical protein